MLGKPAEFIVFHNSLPHASTHDDLEEEEENPGTVQGDGGDKIKKVRVDTARIFADIHAPSGTACVKVNSQVSRMEVFDRQIPTPQCFEIGVGSGVMVPVIRQENAVARHQEHRGKHDTDTNMERLSLVNKINGCRWSC